ncbi:MAG: protein-export membrane protein SecF [Gammaproteobacteria bacterium RIFCSPHIGHO2_12_FULL_45_9]|nr:MAG: protein-export membrane protein SecF [Gammaproteobacteria bacterium RIFCSPHIGHO2_12_FULL_45_9]
MEFFKTHTRIPFMKQRRWAAVFSVIIFVASVIALCVNGLNFGLDFTGGTQVEVSFKSPTTAEQVRASLAQAGFRDTVVQAYNTTDYSIRFRLDALGAGSTGADTSLSAHDEQQLRANLMQALPETTIGSLEYIGPEVGHNLMTNGVLAIVVALLGTMIYIAWRFDYRFAASAAIALVHDPILILGLFSFFHWEFNLIVLAAVLTVIGYSLNDTIVVYDRVRENFRKIKKSTPLEVMDLSINQTLSRTIMTSGLTLSVVVILFFFGGPTLQPFSLALIIGIVIGTYSSIYVAGALAVAMGLNRAALIPVQKQTDGLP